MITNESVKMGRPEYCKSLQIIYSSTANPNPNRDLQIICDDLQYSGKPVKMATHTAMTVSC